MKMKDGTYRQITTLTVPLVFLVALIFSSLCSGEKAQTGRNVRPSKGWEVREIDGNRKGRSVEFTHDAHERYVEKTGETCAICHHLGLPDESYSACYKCHKNMRKESSIFDHELHARIYRDKGAYCNECHGEDRSHEKAKACVDCHPDYKGPASLYTRVIGYESAMHGSCRSCHSKLDEKIGEPLYSACSFCHPGTE